MHRVAPAALTTQRDCTSRLPQAAPARHAAPRRRVVVVAAASPEPDHQPLKSLPFLRHRDPSKLEGAHKPLGLIATSAYVLASAVQLSGVAAGPLWLPVLAGGAVGSAFVALNRAGLKHAWRAPEGPLRVVITGGTKGIGKALAREFLRCGDLVLVASRSETDAAAAARTLLREAGLPQDSSAASGMACDVTDTAAVETLAAAAAAQLGGEVDCWINNAGYSGSFKSLLDQDAAAVGQIVRTNLLGALLCTRAAMALGQTQPGRVLHIFNTEGAGSDGGASPNYAAYGATKAGIAQLCRTLQHECAAAATAGRVAVHNVSPGMVLTDLLLEGATVGNKQVFNVLCEHPETVAAYLVPRVRTVVARGLANQRIRYLTPRRAAARFVTWPLRRGRFFNAAGEAVYPSEAERLSGQHAKRTERLARGAARRSAGLGVAYGASIAAAYLILAADLVAKAHG